jgi:hypothetical protein
VQGNGSGIPHGEVACDIWIISRLPVELLDQRLCTTCWRGSTAGLTGKRTGLQSGSSLPAGYRAKEAAANLHSLAPQPAQEAKMMAIVFCCRSYSSTCRPLTFFKKTKSCATSAELTGDAGITNIMFHAYLMHSQAREYISQLMKSGGCLDIESLSLAVPHYSKGNRIPRNSGKDGRQAGRHI